MATKEAKTEHRPPRPERLTPPEIPQLPDVKGLSEGQASTTYSHFRSGLSRLRTGLSEHRTDLSEHRTDLSEDRTEMSMRRTGMSFQRTRMSADRTLMSVIRTSLSLIGFGFTIFQFFQKLKESGVLEHSGSARNFGTALVCLGIALLIGGIGYHLAFMKDLRGTRDLLKEEGLIHAESSFPVSLTLITAIALLLIGVFAIGNMVFGIGPL